MASKTEIERVVANVIWKNRYRIATAVSEEAQQSPTCLNVAREVIDAVKLLDPFYERLA